MYILEYYENYWVQIFEHKVVTFTHYTISAFHINFTAYSLLDMQEILEVIPESPNAV